MSGKTFNSELERIFADEIGETLLSTGMDELKFLNAETVTMLPELLEKI